MYKKLTLASLLLLINGFIYAQSFSVDATNIPIDACTGCTGPSNNTNLNALSDATLNWSIIDVDVPRGT